MPRRPALAALPFAFGMLLLAGCGSDGASQSASSAPPAPMSGAASPSAGGSTEQSPVVADMEAVCGTSNDQLDAIPDPTTPDEIGTTFTTGLAITDDATKRLDQLASDSDDAATLNTIFVEALKGQTEAIRTFVGEFQAALAEGPEAVQALQEPDLPKADLAAMRDLGFDTCVKLVDE